MRVQDIVGLCPVDGEVPQTMFAGTGNVSLSGTITTRCPVCHREIPIGQREHPLPDPPQRSAWYWPIRALIILIAVVLVGTVLALLLSGCAPQTDRGSGPQAPSEIDQGDADGFTETSIVLSDGREITCVTWSTYDYFHEASYGGVSCDWAMAGTGESE